MVADGERGVVDTADTGEPEDAFDALYLRCAGGLRQQVLVLTGDGVLAARAVERAFDVAWQRWPEVARDDDPVGWVRSAAHAYALAPWQRHLARVRRRPGPTVEGELWGALVRMHPERRRALLLHDGLGMSLPRTAAEIESSTRAAASRVIGARRELAAAAPAGYDGGDASVHLAALLAGAADTTAQLAGTAAPGTAPTTAQLAGTAADTTAPATARGAPGAVPARSATSVREASERGARRRTAASFAAAGAVLVLTTVCVVIGPRQVPSHHHDAPVRQQQATRPSPSPGD